MRCLILAGGFATRLWPLTEKRAKPLLPLKGKPILTHLADAIPGDVAVTVSTNAVFAQAMTSWAGERKDKHIRIYVEDAGKEDEKLGALGAVARWIREEKVDDDVLLLAGDNVIGFSIADFIGASRGHPLLAAHDVKDLEQAKRFGTVVTDGADRVRSVTAFEEKPPHPRSTLVSTGCYLLPRETLPVLVTYAQQAPDNIGGIFEEFLRQHIPVDAFVFGELWRDIGSFHAYLAAHQDLLKGEVLRGNRVDVDETSSLIGSVAIGDDTRIRNSTLENCILFGKTVIDDCRLRDCIIDEQCRLTGVDLTGKMIREGTVLQRA